MNFITAFLIVTCFLSCGQNSNEGNNRKQVSDISTSTIDRWHFKKYLDDPKTPQLAKDIFNNRWKLKDDEPLEYLGSLHGKDKEARPFYFRVVTNSYKQSDGAYAEGLGNAGYEYVKNYPGEFASYFIGRESFTDNDLQTWVNIVMLEFGIISEDEHDDALLRDYLDAIKNNCKECSLQQKAVIEKFAQYLNKQWIKALKDTK